MINGKIILESGKEYNLPDVSYDHFINCSLYKSGSSDIEYDNYLRENNMVELTDFNTSATEEMLIKVSNYNGTRTLTFKCISDVDNDE